MKDIKLTTWIIVLLTAACAAFVVFAQDVGIEDLMNEMKTPAGTNVAVTEPAPVENVPAAAPAVVETPAVVEAPAPVVAEPAPVDKPAVAVEAPAEPAVEKPAVVPVEVPVEVMPEAPAVAPAVEAMPEAPAVAPAVEATPAVAPAIDDLIAPEAQKAPAVQAPVVQAPEVAVPAAEVPAAEAAPVEAPVVKAAAPTDDRSQLATVLAQQEEVRRQARELESRKNMEIADKAWKEDDYERALQNYRNAASKLPTTPAAAAMRSRALARIPVCEYQIVLALVKNGKNESALSRGNEFLAQNADNRDLQKLVARLKKDKQAEEPPVVEEAARVSDKNLSEIKKQMNLGKKAMADRKFELARSSFESALALDPQNRQAMGYLKELGDREYVANTVERQATAAKMSAQVRDRWNPQYKVIKASDAKVEQRQTPKTPQLLDKMEKIVIPEIEFRQANIHDVVGFLNKAAIDGDKSTDDPARKGVNIILNLNPTGSATAAPHPAAAAEDPFGAAQPAGGGGGGQTYEITFQARYITLLQTLKIITSVAGLKYRVEGDIVMIVPADYDPAQIEIKMYNVEPTFITKVQEAGAAMPASSTIGGRTVDRIGGGDLGGTGLPDLKTYFMQMGVKFPAGSSITYNSAIGKVIVGNTAENLATFERILAELNVVPKQVEIEARFVEVNETDLMEAGLEWLLTDPFEIATKKGGSGMLGGTERIQMNANAANGGMTRGLRFWGTGGDGSMQPLTAGAGTMGSVASISSVLTNPELTMILHLLQQNGNADLLSAPKVTTRSGTEASIRVVTEYIYPTAFEVNGGQIGNNTGANANNANIVQETTVTPTDFQTREVGVLLTVLPEVSPDGNMINLTMQPQVVTEPTWYQYGSTVRRADGSEMTLNMPQPFFHVRSLNTQISIYDGATVVMGGLITEELTKVNDKIPLLGDIPVLGMLFRSKSEKSVKKNLLIFVTAKLVDPAGRLIRQPEADATAKPPALAPVAH